MKFSMAAIMIALAASTVSAESMRGLVARRDRMPDAPTTSPGFDKSKITFTFLVQDYEPCGSYGDKVAVCASKNFVCRMETGLEMLAEDPQCLPIDLNSDDRAIEMELALTAPWQPCESNPADVSKPVCRFQFQCMQNNLCMPPDAVPTVESDAAKPVTCGKQICKADEYCQWQESGDQRCAPKPYYK